MMAFIFAMQWLWTLAITFLFLTITQLIGKGLTFLIFGIVGIIAWCALATIPETKGRDLADIHKSMRRRNVAPVKDVEMADVVVDDGEVLM